MWEISQWCISSYHIYLRCSLLGIENTLYSPLELSYHNTSIYPKLEPKSLSKFMSFYFLFNSYIKHLINASN